LFGVVIFLKFQLVSVFFLLFFSCLGYFTEIMLKIHLEGRFSPTFSGSGSAGLRLGLGWTLVLRLQLGLLG
jgi:hypothetical protein